MRRWIIAGFCAAVSLAGIATSNLTAANRVPKEIRKVRDMVFPALVRLDVVTTQISGGTKRTSRGLGSGVIIGPRGHVLTNFHVAGLADQVWVTLSNKERVKAKLIGSDHWTDLAVVQIDLKELTTKGISLHWAHLGDSDSIEVGETVLAMGTPFGLSRTMTRGIVSNATRYFSGRAFKGGYETGQFNLWIQHDAAINPGNSGGPLVDMNGKVIGINTRGAPRGNSLGFAVPSNVARRVVDELIARGKVTRSYVGMKFQPMRDMERLFGVDADEGVLIREVDPNGPAFAAGIRPDDILMKIDGEEVNVRFPEQLPALARRLASRPVGSTIRLAVKRRNRMLPFVVRTQRLESSKGKQKLLVKWGVTVRQITAAYVRRHKLPNDRGVLIEGVRSGGLAAKAGIRSGDIIRKLHMKPVANLKSFRIQYAKLIRSKPRRILIELLRGQTTQLIVIKNETKKPVKPKPAVKPKPTVKPKPKPVVKPRPKPASRPTTRQKK